MSYVVKLPRRRRTARSDEPRAPHDGPPIVLSFPRPPEIQRETVVNTAYGPIRVVVEAGPAEPDEDALPPGYALKSVLLESVPKTSAVSSLG